MFAGLKNKIREETGSDVAVVVKKAGNVRNVGSRHLSQAGSSSSVSGSALSLNGFREENNTSPTSSVLPAPLTPTPLFNTSDLRSGEIAQLTIKNAVQHATKDVSQLGPRDSMQLVADDVQILSKEMKKLENMEEEWKQKLQRRESELLKKIETTEEEWKTKLQEREKEWMKISEKHAKEKSKLDEERKAAEAMKQSLEAALKSAEEYRKKYYALQEDTEQLEGFQTQEMAKIKHLLLAKEQEVEEKNHHLKTITTEMNVLKTEVSRLRRYEEELNNVQDEMETLRHSTQRERAQLSSQLAKTEEEARHLNDKVFVLEQRISLESNDRTVDERVADLMRERTLLERKLEEAHLHLSDIKTSWSGKISSLETQVGRLSRQAGEEGLERRRVEREREELKQKVKDLEAEIEVNKVVMQTKDAKLLRMAEDIDEMAVELKELRANYDDEIEEFKRDIESSSKEIQKLESELKKTTSELEDVTSQLKDITSKWLDVKAQLVVSTTELSQLQVSLEEEKSNSASLHMQVERFRESLEAERTSAAALQISMEKEKEEKDIALLRNAQVSQDFELSQQECRQQEHENNELQSRIEALENAAKAEVKQHDEYREELTEARKRLAELEVIERDKEASAANEARLKSTITDLEAQLDEKRKTNKVLQQRLADMKKTLQRELRIPSTSLDSDAEAPTVTITPSSTKTVVPGQENSREDDVNFKYLKHVLIKFLTSREYEALHLTRAVATLLHFSPEEEKLLQETLEWKMSWFGNRPNLGIGQGAKAIPPS